REPSPALPSGSLPNTPTGNRTPVFWLRTRCPRPLDDGGIHQPNLSKHARQDSNLQPPVLETGALPIELRASGSRVRPVTASWPGAESNCRHHDFQSCALPTELPGRSAHLSCHSASRSHQYSGRPAKSPKATELPGRSAHLNCHSASGGNWYSRRPPKSAMAAELPGRSAHLNCHSASRGHQYSGRPAKSPKATELPGRSAHLNCHSASRGHL